MCLRVFSLRHFSQLLAQSETLQVPVFDIISREVPKTERKSGYEEETFIVMEKSDRGSLLTQGPKLSEEFQRQRERGLLKILRCLLDVAFALEYLHGIGVVHGEARSKGSLYWHPHLP